MDTSPESRADRLGQAIDEKPGLNGTKLAGALGVSTATISRWRTGKDQISLERIIEIAPHVDRSVGWLWAGDDAWAPPKKGAGLAVLLEGLEVGEVTPSPSLIARVNALEAELAVHRGALVRAGLLKEHEQAGGSPAARAGTRAAKAARRQSEGTPETSPPSRRARKG